METLKPKNKKILKNSTKSKEHINPSDFFGIISKKQAEDLRKHLKEIRDEI
jgi:hypothetical protein